MPYPYSLSKARDQTHILTDNYVGFLTHWATMGTPVTVFSKNLYRSLSFFFNHSNNLTRILDNIWCFLNVAFCFTLKGNIIFLFAFVTLNTYLKSHSMLFVLISWISCMSQINLMILKIIKSFITVICPPNGLSMLSITLWNNFYRNGHTFVLHHIPDSYNRLLKRCLFPRRPCGVISRC